jgi:Arc/MetJ family transcription regulator
VWLARKDHQMLHHMMRYTVRMRTTVTLDDELLKDAQEYSGIEDRSALLRAALTALVQREAARRLAHMEGSQPGIKAAPRRRPTR